MKRTVIKIDEDLCFGCGNCVNGCHEGALQLIDGKAVMVSDLYCDGLGACIGECPVNAITLEEREAEPYNEEAVMERIAPKGEAVILAHLNHLKSHGEKEWVKQGLDYLKKHNIKVNFPEEEQEACGCSGSTPQAEEKLGCGCPGSMAREIKAPIVIPDNKSLELPSELRQFPVQLHLLNPAAGFLQGANLLLAADCTAFAYGDFHRKFLKGKILAIACPKLDSNTQSYVDKLVLMIDQAKIETLTIVIMEVPCCGGLMRIAEIAREQANRNIPLKKIVVSVEGNILSEEWV
ncbi:4Fe-4S binding protein [Odoribacter sp. OttesenSCG-928-J03]|nr:4Fe-4S binding protein [Odoribacter sp. OttesenSCG-928-J03]MDL2282999.1 4Fe-4S binding protein [Odoribacter sp. OttesenSCG-928-G04]MDL2331107.1 4Fe-4S binding protein [Odoribacter sp. OttesenSCG-928-A06]